ncbi:MAG: ribonucleoside triphosphate reductase, partial [Alphaproteobacteria bacterium]|nr:ribonucleoside triphosphate reductase [Alphaproteobacteria bacterium]
MLEVVQNKPLDPAAIDIGPLQSVITREGQTISFDASKIVKAIERAGQATEEFGLDEAWSIAGQVVKVLKHRFTANKAPTIEQIQDVVEQTLISSNFFKTARAYIVYREQRERSRQDRKAVVDAISSINEYLDKADWRVNANANQGYSLGGLILNTSGKMVANYWLTHVYPKEVGEAHKCGDYHIHDLDMLSGY